MSKNKNRKKDNYLPKQHLSIEDEVVLKNREISPSLDLPQEVVVPDKDIPPTINNTFHFSQLIGGYIDGSLSHNQYNFGLVDTASDNAFDLVVSNDETVMASNMYPAYIIKSNKKYTKKEYTVFLNAKVYSNLPPGNQIFIKPYLTTLDKRLIPEEFKTNAKNMPIDYDLTDPIDTLALFINVCNTSSFLKDKRLPHKKIYNFMHDTFIAYLNGKTDGVILKEITENDVFG